MARRPPAVARVVGRVTQTVRQHDMFQPGDLVLVWVSGGPDSVCLLEVLVRIQRLLRVRLAVFHMDHRLRPDSSKDAAYVRRLAHRHRLPFHLGVARDAPGRSRSVEMWARDERIREAGRVASAIGATRHADGHTMDDQAETVLMGLVLGWGPEGMSGISPVNGLVCRPMLDVTRAEVETFCAALRLRPRRDPMNEDTSLLRNAIRLEAIPEIERATGRDVKATFASTAELLRRESDALSELAAEHADRLTTATDGGFVLAARPLVELPPALGARVVRRAFQRGGIAWDRASIESVLDLASGRLGRRVDLVAGSRARRDRTHVVVTAGGRAD